MNKLRITKNHFFIISLTLIFALSSNAEDDAYNSLLKKYEQKIKADIPPESPKNEPKAEKEQDSETLVKLPKKIKKKSGSKRKEKNSDNDSVKNQQKDQNQESQKASIPAPVAGSEPGKMENKSKEPESAKNADDKEPGLSGNWNGIRTKIINSGYEISLSYKGDYYSILSGPEEKGSGFLGDVDLTLNLNLEKILGLNGLNFFIYGLGNHGNHPSERFGDSFVSSNIEAPSTFKIYEAYFKKSFDEGRFEMLLGLRDLNVDYYALESSGYFINSSFGVSPSLAQTGVHGPSIFPNAAPALTTKFKGKDNFYFQSGFFNATAGDPDKSQGTQIPMSLKNGNLLISELGVESISFIKKLSIGAWQYSKPFDNIDTTTEPTSNSYGNYLMADFSLTDKLSFFSKLGYASPKVSTFSQSIETGLVFIGPWKARPDDALFMGYSRANASDDYKAINNSKSFESVFEVGYKFKVVEGFWFTPDYQEVVNPGLVGEPAKGSIFIFRTNLLF